VETTYYKSEVRSLSPLCERSSVEVSEGSTNSTCTPGEPQAKRAIWDGS
jgi:hypothetical protein